MADNIIVATFSNVNAARDAARAITDIKDAGGTKFKLKFVTSASPWSRLPNSFRYGRIGSGQARTSSAWRLSMSLSSKRKRANCRKWPRHFGILRRAVMAMSGLTAPSSRDWRTIAVFTQAMREPRRVLERRALNLQAAPSPAREAVIKATDEDCVFQRLTLSSLEAAASESSTSHLERRYVRMLNS